MLFSDRLTEQEVLEAKGPHSEELLDALLCDFRSSFPDLTFELQLGFRIIEAQALQLQDKRTVTLYGGLALHPRLGQDALTFILLHESGHHLAEGCPLPRDPSLACQCSADYWATTTGAETLKRKPGRCLRMSAVIIELNTVISPSHKSGGKYTGAGSTSGCWANGWPSRRQALFDQARPPAVPGCCI